MAKKKDPGPMTATADQCAGGADRERRPMSTEEAVATINGYLHLDGAVTHKGDEVKCYVRDLTDGGVHKTYLGVVECQELADAFGLLAINLDFETLDMSEGLAPGEKVEVSGQCKRCWSVRQTDGRARVGHIYESCPIHGGQRSASASPCPRCGK